MKYKLGLGIGITTLLLSGTAFAADMPIKGHPPITPYYSWTGFYVGANLGYGWASGSGTITISGATGPVSGSGHGIFGGAQAGYNWQTGSFVYGIEADIQASAQKGNYSGSAGANSFTGTASIPWFGTLRGRLGYAFDRTMLYITGGGFFGDGKAQGVSSVTGPFSTSRMFETYTVGGGVETALWNRWTAKLEYLYVGPPNHVPGPPGTTAIKGSSHGQLVRAGINYRF
jgi:outer membrane immunogenic protein